MTTRNALPKPRPRREAPRAAEAIEARFARAEQLAAIEARLATNAQAGAPTRPRPWPRPGEPTPRRDAELALAEDKRRGALGEPCHPGGYHGTHPQKSTPVPRNRP
jgi:hypothetical protein